MGLLDFLFAGAVINSVKKARNNDSQQTLHGRVSNYDHGYEEGYDDGCYDHSFHDDCDCHDTYDCGGYHDDCDCHDTYDCGGYEDDCDYDCNW